MDISKGSVDRQWWHRPLIPTLRIQSQVDLYKSKDSLVYRVSYRITRAAQRNSVSIRPPPKNLVMKVCFT